MSSIILYHHLGLGDHIMCHGIVREYCKKYEKVAIFCLPNNLPSVSFMYQYLTNLNIIECDYDSPRKFFVQKTFQFEKLNYDEIKIIGYQDLNKNSNTPLEMQFYQLAGVPFNKKWDSFFINRDYEKEQKFLEKIAPKEDYAFIHEDVPRGFIINREFVDKNCSLLSAEKSHTDNIIDYCTIIEKAKEIHVIDSSFMFLIDFLKYDNPNQKLFIHRYARENHEWLLPILKKDWHIFIQRHDGRELGKEILTKLCGNHNTIFKKIIRRIFKKMGWDMIRQKYPDLKALIRRYVYEKSFLVISPNNKSNDYLSTAKASGAITTNESILEEAGPADTVFYSGEFSTIKNQQTLLKKLHSLTKTNIIFHTKDCNPKYLEKILIQVGFETREKHLFPSEVCFVCKLIS